MYFWLHWGGGYKEYIVKVAPDLGKSFSLFFLFSLMWTTFKAFTEFVTILPLFYILVFLTVRHVES